MGTYRVVAFFLFFLVAACAENRVGVDLSKEGDYVEISNPAFTMSPGAPATIWVPRKSVEKGIPRGGEVLKKGYESVVDEIKGSPQQGLPKNSQPTPDNKPGELYRENQFR